MSSEQVAKVQQTTVAQTQNVSQNAQTQWSNQQQIIASNPNIAPANNNTNTTPATPAASNASNNSKTPANSTPTWNNNAGSSNGGNNNANTNSGHENWTNIYTTTREAYWENYEITDDVWIPAEYTDYWENTVNETGGIDYGYGQNLVPGTGCWKFVPTGKWENKYTPEEGFWQNFCF